ncbi:hypothetical protein BCR42DRAFT_428291, partial [Absidia repens]
MIRRDYHRLDGSGWTNVGFDGFDGTDPWVRGDGGGQPAILGHGPCHSTGHGFRRHLHGTYADTCSSGTTRTEARSSHLCRRRLVGRWDTSVEGGTMVHFVRSGRPILYIRTVLRLPCVIVADDHATKTSRIAILNIGYM